MLSRDDNHLNVWFDNKPKDVRNRVMTSHDWQRRRLAVSVVHVCFDWNDWTRKLQKVRTSFKGSDVTSTVVCQLHVNKSKLSTYTLHRRTELWIPCSN